ncbi:hypothetical protein LDENG_00109000 [Lucifuga dentata]|nr:hypothetical protein LDENG_00109000 [Lucifuga dentata]
MALKQEVAVGILKRRLGKEAALAKVESVLASEQRLQDQLIQFRLTNIKLNIKIFKLDAEFFIMAEKAKKSNEELDPFDVMSREAQKEYERQRKLVKRVTRQILAARRLLPNIKEKLSWTERMIKERKPQLAVLDTLIAEKSKTLARTKQACNRLHRENLKLEESRGLLGNRVLLQDFEDTVDDCDRLEEKLQKLKCQEAETVLQRRKWKQT